MSITAKAQIILPNFRADSSIEYQESEIRPGYYHAIDRDGYNIDSDDERYDKLPTVTLSAEVSLIPAEDEYPSDGFVSKIYIDEDLIYESSPTWTDEQYKYQNYSAMEKLFKLTGNFPYFSTLENLLVGAGWRAYHG